MKPRLCVVIPAYNEEIAIVQTIEDYRSAFPEATIVVVDNNSKDKTFELASSAIDPSRDYVLRERQQGKGYAVKTALSRVEADIYIMTDADDTYPASDTVKLYEEFLESRPDMMVGDRVSGGNYAKQNQRAGHNWGNRFLTLIISQLSGKKYNDVLSGLRIMSRPFVDTLDVSSAGFQLETELNIIAAYVRADVIEQPIAYRKRPEGSSSKLNTLRDGIRILWFAIINAISFYPLQVFSLISSVFFLVSAYLVFLVFSVFFATGSMPYPSTAVAAAASGLVALQLIFAGVILHITGRANRRDKVAGLLGAKRIWNSKIDGSMLFGVGKLASPRLIQSSRPSSGHQGQAQTDASASLQRPMLLMGRDERTGSVGTNKRTDD
jgi:glycosyltransferase involved in cell wall biosynthesis